MSTFWLSDGVAAAVDLGFPSERAKLLGHPFAALLLEKSGGGNAAQLQVLFVDPGSFAPKPIEARLHRRLGGKRSGG